MSDDPATEDRPAQSPSEERAAEQPDAPRARASSRARANRPSGRARLNLLVVSFLSFFVIGFGVWLVSAGKRYREEYAQATEGWRVGSTRSIELTLVKDDKTNLACASDFEKAGLRCAFRRNGRDPGPLPPDSPQILQPYNTVANEVLLGAGLWNAPDMKNPLPRARFTVVCNYTIKAVTKSASVRFNPASAFAPLGRTVSLGTLTDCMLPR